MLATSINLQLEPGQKVTLQPVSWEGFEEILTQLGEFRTSRIAYSNEILEIMAPLPEHERSKVLLADLVKVLLKIQKQAWEPFGSSTFKRRGMSAGIEPDDCFYIQNYQAVIGKQRIDLDIDPPPSGFAVAHGGNPQDHTVSPPTDFSPDSSVGINCVACVTGRVRTANCELY